MESEKNVTLAMSNLYAMARSYASFTPITPACVSARGIDSCFLTGTSLILLHIKVVVRDTSYLEYPLIEARCHGVAAGIHETKYLPSRHVQRTTQAS